MLMEVTDASIVAQALQKAIDNGYSLGEGEQDKLVDYAQFLLDQGVVMAILVQHKFCQALWGEREERNATPEELSNYRGNIGGAKYTVNEGWQYHLQRMIMSKDPIEYLAKNI